MFRELYYRNISMDEAERRQDDIDGVLGALSSYSAKKKKNILKQRIGSWIMQKAFKRGGGGEKLIEVFKYGIFPLNYDEEEEQNRFE